VTQYHPGSPAVAGDVWRSPDGAGEEQHAVEE